MTISNPRMAGGKGRWNARCWEVQSLGGPASRPIRSPLPFTFFFGIAFSTTSHVTSTTGIAATCMEEESKKVVVDLVEVERGTVEEPAAVRH